MKDLRTLESIREIHFPPIHRLGIARRDQKKYLQYEKERSGFHGHVKRINQKTLVQNTHYTENSAPWAKQMYTDLNEGWINAAVTHDRAILEKIRGTEGEP